MNPNPTNLDLKKLFQLWVDSDIKVQVVVFFHDNPGMVETVDGLARRMGTTPDALQPEIADEIRLGFLKERTLGSKKVLVYDREGETNIRRFIEERLRTQRLREAT